MIRRPLILMASGVVGLLLLAAAAGPLAMPHDPYAMDAASTLAPPSLAHPMGTDAFGRDVLSRVVSGARTSVLVAAGSVGLALAAGVSLGLAAGYLGGLVDAAISRSVDGLLAFPDILLALVVMAVLGPSTLNLVLAIALVYTPVFVRVTRGAAIEVGARGFVAAAEAVGAGRLRIMFRHILPNLSGPIAVQTTLSLAFAILAEAGLSFLGLGVEPDAPSWGNMLAEGKDWMELAWWMPLFPGLAITLAVLALNVLGDEPGFGRACSAGRATGT